MNEELQERPPDGEFKIYRQLELQRVTACLLANGSILVVGEEGSGKSVLGSAVIKKLSDDGFLVASVEPTTPKQMMTEICFCLDIPTETLRGKSLTIEKLKIAIADFFKENTAFLILDDAQNVSPQYIGERVIQASMTNQKN